MTRRGVITKHSPIIKSQRKFFPIYDWSQSDLQKVIRDSGVKLPIDYKIWGRSFDGLDYRFIKPLYDKLPESYEHIKKWYPLLDVNRLRYNSNS